jgi:hypothetical protein
MLHWPVTFRNGLVCARRVVVFGWPTTVEGPRQQPGTESTQQQRPRLPDFKPFASPYRIFWAFNSFAISLTTPSITFCADFGLNESLVPVQISSPAVGEAV